VRGRLITIEGLDGAGKTTLASSLCDVLSARGLDVRLLREPGGVPVAERVRELVKDPQLQIGARAEALLYAAARAQLVEQEIAPLLEQGSWVLLDRFIDSSLAYQGAGRGLGVEEVRAINEFGTGGLAADRTLVLTIEPAAGLARAEARAGPPDRLEQEHRAFFEAIAAAYAQLVATEPDRVRAIDADQPPKTVLSAALAELQDLLKEATAS
jgi:dTMP kinase